MKFWKTSFLWIKVNWSLRKIKENFSYFLAIFYSFFSLSDKSVWEYLLKYWKNIAEKGNFFSQIFDDKNFFKYNFCSGKYIVFCLDRLHEVWQALRGSTLCVGVRQEAEGKVSHHCNSRSPLPSVLWVNYCAVATSPALFHQFFG